MTLAIPIFLKKCEKAKGSRPETIMPSAAINRPRSRASKFKRSGAKLATHDYNRTPMTITEHLGEMTKISKSESGAELCNAANQLLEQLFCFWIILGPDLAVLGD